MPAVWVTVVSTNTTMAIRIITTTEPGTKTARNPCRRLCWAAPRKSMPTKAARWVNNWDKQRKISRDRGICRGKIDYTRCPVLMVIVMRKCVASNNADQLNVSQFNCIYRKIPRHGTKAVHLKCVVLVPPFVGEKVKNKYQVRNVWREGHKILVLNGVSFRRGRALKDNNRTRFILYC